MSFFVGRQKLFIPVVLAILLLYCYVLLMKYNTNYSPYRKPSPQSFLLQTNGSSDETPKFHRKRSKPFFRAQDFDYENMKPIINAKSKTILFWNSFFGYNYVTLNVGPLNCPPNKGQCKFETNDRKNKALIADAILFHQYDVNTKDIPPARASNSSQVWVLYGLEPTTDNTRHIFEALNGQIDLTAFFRLDSSILVPYGWIRNRTSEDQPTNFNLESEAIFNKKETAVWMVSHCKTEGKREEYVAKLQKHLKLDIFGACGKPSTICKPRSSDDRNTCYSNLAAKYKFYLSFESVIGRDYVTEKFFQPLSKGMIPVVFGGADYSEIAPAGSYINAFDFKSPKHLAEHINKIAANFTLYKEYFEWREKYVVDYADSNTIESRRWLCELCSYLYQPQSIGGTNSVKQRKNLIDWWLKGKDLTY